MSDLMERDYYLLIDKSGSMAEKDCKGESRWKAAQESTLAVAEKISQFDSDGITVIPFASGYKVYQNTTPATVKNIFIENDPMGGTNLAAPLTEVFQSYLMDKNHNRAKKNGALLLVVTDGSPNDPQNVVEAIVNFTKKLDKREEFGISFLQIGRDEAAKIYLKKLDNDLQDKGAKFDIVNTKTFEELENVGLTEALFDALSK